MISGIFRMSMWNQTVPDELRGRMAGLELLSFTTGPQLGQIRSGLMAQAVSLRFSIASGGFPRSGRGRDYRGVPSNHVALRRANQRARNCPTRGSSDVSDHHLIPSGSLCLGVDARGAGLTSACVASATALGSNGSSSIRPRST